MGAENSAELKDNLAGQPPSRVPKEKLQKSNYVTLN